MKKSTVGSLWFLPFVIFVFSSCSTAHEANPSGFLDDYSKLKEGSYFKQEYIVKDFDYSRVKTIKVAPVNLSHLDDKTSCDTDALENLGRDFREDIESQLEKAGFSITSNPSGETLIISLALTNVEPPAALLNVGLTAASLVTGIPMPFDKDGTTAFEGKITDGATGKLLAEFSEQRSGSGDEMTIKTMTVGKFQKFTNSEAVFVGWSQTIAKMIKDLNTGTAPGSKSNVKGVTKQLVGLAV